LAVEISTFAVKFVSFAVEFVVLALQFVTLAIELDAFAMELGAFALEFVVFAIRHGYNDCRKLTTCHEVNDFLHGGSHLGQRKASFTCRLLS